VLGNRDRDLWAPNPSHPELARHGEAKGVAWFQDLSDNAILNNTNAQGGYLFQTNLSFITMLAEGSNKSLIWVLWHE
jgi:hypothetical protein